MDKGTRWVMETYDRKDTLSSKSITTVKETNSMPDGAYSAKIQGKVFDRKEKVLGAVDYEIRCQDGNILISMNSFLNPEQMTTYQDMDVEIDGDFLELPSDIEPGMSLPDASVAVKIQNAGIAVMTLTISISDRKVEKFETITTPAGTFECAKITYVTESKMGSAIPINVSYSGAEWLAKGTGMVRSEQYDKKQNMVSYTLLSEFSN